MPILQPIGCPQSYCVPLLYLSGRVSRPAGRLSSAYSPVYRLWRHTRVPVPLEQGKPLFSRAGTVMPLAIVRGTVEVNRQ